MSKINTISKRQLINCIKRYAKAEVASSWRGQYYDDSYREKIDCDLKIATKKLNNILDKLYEQNNL